MPRKKPPKKIEAVPPQATISRRSKPWIDTPPATELATDPLGDILQAVPPKSFQPPVKSTGMECVCPTCHRLLEIAGPHDCRPDPLGDILRQQLQQGEEYRRQTPQTPTP